MSRNTIEHWFGGDAESRKAKLCKDIGRARVVKDYARAHSFQKPWELLHTSPKSL